MSHPLDEITVDKPDREDYEAILRARARGVTWAKIAEVLGRKPNSMPQLFRALKAKYGK